MTKSYVFTAAASLFLFLLAFSTGAPAFLAPAFLLVLLLIYAPVSVLLARRSLSVQMQLLTDHVRRGDHAALTLSVRFRSLLPVSPLHLKVSIDDVESESTLDIPCSIYTKQFSLSFPARHAGCMHPGVNLCTIHDLFGLYHTDFVPRTSHPELLVLPLDFEVAPLVYAQVDAGLGTMAKANEDITSPSDIRSYQTGDPMKKIHWKLSARKQELLVRKFDEPVLPDALLLLNCEKPESLAIQDALLETAFSVMKKELSGDHAIQAPLLGAHPTELDGRMGLPLLAENLARMQWTNGTSFEEVLLIESRRLRRCGATAIITSSLNGELVEIMCQMRRMGPSLRLYLVTFTPSDPNLLPFVSRMQNADCEVCYVKPSETT
ncbi:MAG: DUF58 domain-containing protein [Clostridiales bacterium]|nr:DUF58 domain-containing protein [Clostridiales bacterium]